MLGQLSVAGPGLGGQKSFGAGKGWVQVDRRWTSRYVIVFAADNAVPDTIYAVVAEQGIYRHEDVGAGWRMMDKGPEAEIQRIIHSNLEGSMQSGWLFAATDRGVYRDRKSTRLNSSH